MRELPVVVMENSIVVRALAGKTFVILGCVRLGNPNLDFQNLNPDFPIGREIHLREIRPQGGFQLRNSNPDFLDFPF